MTAWRIYKTERLIAFLEAAMAGRITFPHQLNLSHLVSRLYAALPDYPQFPVPIIGDGWVDGEELRLLLDGEPESPTSRLRRRKPDNAFILRQARERMGQIKRNQGRTR